TPGTSGTRCGSRRRPSCAAARSCPASVRGGELVDLVLADRLDHALLAATQTLHGEHRATLSSHRGAAALLAPADRLLELVGARAADVSDRGRRRRSCGGSPRVRYLGPRASARRRTCRTAHRRVRRAPRGPC